jgi:polar amino acid transport system permease protein
MESFLTILAQYGPRLASGLCWTFGMWLAGAILAVVVGLGITLLQMAGIRPLNWLCRSYIAVIRGTPFLIQLFLLYYAAPSIGIRFDAVTVGVLGLGIYGSAYFAEIFRAGFVGIPVGHTEAARVLGFSRRQIFLRINLPQMVTNVVPATFNQLIILLKESSILSIITIPELTTVASGISSETFKVTAPYLAMALLYWILVQAVAQVGQLAEKRTTGYLR